MENLKEVCYKYDLLKSNAQLIVDDGSENNGSINEFLTLPHVQLKKQIAQIDIRQSNSMIEAVNKRLKYDYLFTKEFQISKPSKLFFHWPLIPITINLWSFYQPLHLLKYYMALSRIKTGIKNHRKSQLSKDRRPINSKNAVLDKYINWPFIFWKISFHYWLNIQVRFLYFISKTFRHIRHYI